jgi:hypothetical protein
MNGVTWLARAELRKLFTTRALPVSFAVAIVLAIGSVIIDAMVAGKNGSPRLGTDAPGPGPGHSLPAAVAGVVLAGYGIVMLLAASRITVRRDVV